MVPYSRTYGALVVGGFLSLFLSGIVATQVFLYRRSYAGDRLRIQLMVLVVWLLDLTHSSFVIASVFHYVVDGYSDTSAINRVHWPISVTISITGFLTFLIHIFFAHRVWTLSKRNIWLTTIIGSLAFLRMVSAFGTATQLQRLKSWSAFHDHAAWIFTTGLSISASVDVITAVSLCFYLQKRRTGFSSMDHIIDSIMVYTVETGMLTSIATIASFICWLTMPQNFIFLAFHFCITKLYANSFLASLNARQLLKERSVSTVEAPNSFRLPTLLSSKQQPTEAVSARKYPTHTGDSTLVSLQGATTRNSLHPTSTLQISVEKTVHCVTDVAESDGEIESLEPAYIPRESTEQPFSSLAKV
ncbi:hypothetical protein PHLGIDRAFT_127401 [Phlebiopsis gigantea 11061_1 CR5-6]|uniref:DUF6534 domain-containing protein n=1 Tax=Phlebiopsis gigantea (strain 11061_1 CR5-6) TaxID=745531 RepID=A0A0C3PMG2_PHLG1|nr:hypothetical protein PHLGIDRAFT_127401 [Phlebiopsis gigantea 11061_1 CR5-6]